MESLTKFEKKKFPQKHKFADLHMHTHFSDGSFTPEQLIVYAAGQGLSCVSITDHDSVEAVSESVKFGAEYGIEVIPGVELSAEKNSKEIHILGYFINYQDPELLKILKDKRVLRWERMRQMMENLKKHNINLNIEDVIGNSHKDCAIGRLHLAKAMKNAGYVKNLKQAFNKYIGDGKSCYVSGFYMSCEEAIELIHDFGGISVVAHPYVLHDDAYIKKLKECGLKGIEVFHSDHPNPIRDFYLKFAQDNKLLITGGSDCHGAGKEEMLMGRVKLDYKYVEELKRLKTKD